MTERQSETTPEDGTSAAQAKAHLSMQETTTEDGRKAKTYTYEIFAGKLGHVLASSRREQRDMRPAPDSDSDIMVKTEMEVISAFAGSELADTRDFVRLSREFIPPLESAEARAFAVLQMSYAIVGTLILSRECIVDAVMSDEDASTSPPSEQQPPAGQPPATEQ